MVSCKRDGREALAFCNVMNNEIKVNYGRKSYKKII